MGNWLCNNMLSSWWESAEWHTNKVLMATNLTKKSRPVPLFKSSYEARLAGVTRERGLRILVIDGGGSKGIIAATVLKKIEQELSILCAGSQVHLADHFDLVAGTSAGGMIALAHAHRRLPLDTVSDFFASGAAFSRPWYDFVPQPVVGFLRGFAYSGPQLERLLKTALGEEKLDGKSEGRKRRMLERDDVKYHPECKRPRVFALSNPCNTLRHILFTNYPADEYTRESVKDTGDVPLVCSGVSAWEAARATSAAPTFFPVADVKIPKDRAKTIHCFWDGGLVNNSPVAEAITQAQMLFGYDREIELVVSIGCGTVTKNKEKEEDANELDFRSLKENFKYGLGGSLRNDIINAVTNSEKEFTQARRNLRASADTKTRNAAYNSLYRLNPDIFTESDKLALDESSPGILEKAKENTIKWCEKEKNQQMLKRIATVLQRGKAQQSSAEDLPRLERMRITALNGASSLAPALVSLPKNSELRKNDPRLCHDHKVEDWINKYESSICGILDYLEEVNMDPKTWAKTNEISGLSREVETLRLALWRGYLNRLIEEVKRFKSEEEKRQYLKDFGLKRLERIESMLLPLDKANAMYRMKINRSDPICPVGIGWISKAGFASYKQLDLKWEGEKLRASIDSNHVLLVTLFDSCEMKEEKEFAQKLNSYCQPEMPEWMKDKEGFKVLYEDVMRKRG